MAILAFEEATTGRPIREINHENTGKLVCWPSAIYAQEMVRRGQRKCRREFIWIPALEICFYL